MGSLWYRYGVTGVPSLLYLVLFKSHRFLPIMNAKEPNQVS